MKFCICAVLVAAALWNSCIRAETTDYPPVKLRGYGLLSGSLAETGRGSVLKIDCESSAKAKLVQAKYISDLQVLPGVTSATAGTISSYHMQDQGWIAAGRHGPAVFIYSAADEAGLERLLAGAGKSLAFRPAVTVPMYLDRWDKYGFRFYYAPFTAPKGPNGREVSDYNTIDDFNFARDCNHSGLQFWHASFPVESGEASTNLTWWKWAADQALDYGLPIGINDGIEDKDSWLMNRYPEDIIQHQPQFLGGWYMSMDFSEDIISWNALDTKEIALAQMQQTLRKVGKMENVTSWLEPHEEMGHGVANLLVEYGPVADRGFRAYLKKLYHTPSAVSRRWFGNGDAYKSWNDIHAPELASFLGWGKDAIDLTGTWRISYDAPFAPESASPSLDDSSWAETTAPGDPIARFLPRQPAVYRRHIEIDPAWRSAHGRVWIYIWDLNNVLDREKNPRDSVQIYVNGTLIPETPPKVTQDHWAGLEVTKQLVAGDNLITVTLPRGIFNYRAYLSPHEPKLYPNLGPGGNASWVDFFDWNVAIRVAAVRRGTQMIRQFDPDRGVMLMSPDAYIDGIRSVSKDYGADFHNTGSMGGFWNEYLPAIAHGAGMPMSVEPGGPAKTVDQLKKNFGLWITEGANAIDYFGNEGDILWNPAIKKCFQDNLPVFTSIGKYHAPTAQAAALYSNRNNALLDFPWGGGQGYGSSDPEHLGSGYWKWNVRAPLRGVYETDALTEGGFSDGSAEKYRVIFDTDTAIVDDKLLSGIEHYVRNGGTFVTYVQTGRHTATEKDSWPIDKLTGYRVVRLNQANPWQRDAIKWADKQSIFSGDWIDGSKADGLSLQKAAPDAIDLAYWKSDGTVAIGMRRLGKGTIIEVGCRFTAWGLPDRIDEEIWSYLKTAYGRLAEYGFPDTLDHGLFTPELLATRELFSQVLKWRGIHPVPWSLKPFNENLVVRHYISNNGLYDVWAIWNQSPDKPASGSLALSQDVNPKWAINLLDSRRISVANRALPINLAPVETAIYLTPRAKFTEAAGEWFALQRNWWAGTASPGKPIPPFEPKLAVDLTDGWAFKPLEANKDAKPLADPKIDDSQWKRMSLGIYTLPGYPNVQHAIFRKWFTVPAAWNHGRVALWIQSWTASTFLPACHVYVDGKPLQDASSEGITNNEMDGALRAGSRHLLAVEIIGQRNGLAGSRGPAWISYHPAPLRRQDLAGDWELSMDDLHYSRPSPLPGPSNAQSARREVLIDGSQSGRTVVLHANGNGRFLWGVIVNGHYACRFHSNIGTEVNLNITPWVQFGKKNELVLIGHGDKRSIVTELSLEYHKKGTYP